MGNSLVIESQIIESKKELNNKECVLTTSSLSYNLLKRIADIIFSFGLLILLLPLLILVAVTIKFDSSGPAIFKQKRIGKNQIAFTMYKFRTMVENAEDMYKEILEKEIKENKMIRKNSAELGCDPRVTKVGVFLRKYSIDEIPQLINVLIGNMSLIGPRPNLPLEYRQLDQEWYKVRYMALPGISGLWQIRGRSSLPPEKMFELDYEYVMKRSLLLDLKIFFKTIPVVLKCEGAE